MLLYKKDFSSVNLQAGKRGFSAIEILVVLAIIGMISLILYPNIMNSLETRDLENTARDVLTTLQRAKFQAVRTKLNHRVRFTNESGGWAFVIEREDDPSQWNEIPGFIRKAINSKFNVTVSLPSQVVDFSPLGFVSNFTLNQNSITIQSPKLESQGQPDLRVISVFAGGSIQYNKTQSE